MTPATPADLQSFYLDEFMDMTKDLPRHNFAAVNADCKRVSAEEKAALLTPHQMQTRIQALRDAADPDCIDIAEDALAEINARCKEIEQQEQAAEDFEDTPSNLAQYLSAWHK